MKSALVAPVPPPAMVSSSMSGVPNGTSTSPGSATRPITVTSFVPRADSLPTEAKASAEWAMIQAACARVSAFCTTVGAPSRPCVAGNGGRMAGMPRSPASALMSAVSSPATYAPEPSHTDSWMLTSVPSTR